MSAVSADSLGKVPGYAISSTTISAWACARCAHINAIHIPRRSPELSDQAAWRVGAPLIPICEIAAASYWCLGGVWDRIRDSNSRQESPELLPILTLARFLGLECSFALTGKPPRHVAAAPFHNRTTKTACHGRPRLAKKKQPAWTSDCSAL